MREYLCELMHLTANDDARFSLLQADDRTLNEYTLEQNCTMPLFDWIRDFKDFEAR